MEDAPNDPPIRFGEPPHTVMLRRIDREPTLARILIRQWTDEDRMNAVEEDETTRLDWKRSSCVPHDRLDGWPPYREPFDPKARQCILDVSPGDDEPHPVVGVETRVETTFVIDEHHGSNTVRGEPRPRDLGV